MKLVVLGSNSFSGSHFVRYAVEQGLDVLGISRSAVPSQEFWPMAWGGGAALRGKCTTLQADLNNDLPRVTDAIAKFEPELIVNFAALGMVAESWKHPLDYFHTNLLAQVALHEKLRGLRGLKKFVHVSTPEVYGNTSGNIDETAPLHPSTPYAASRAACDLHLETFLKEYGFPVVWTRAANVFGPGQQLYRIVPRAFLSLRAGKKLPLHGGGKSVRSFIHIRDVCTATLEIALKAAPGSIYHLSTPRALPIRELVEIMCAMVGGDFNSVVEVHPERPGKDSAYLLNSDRMRREFGWSDKISLEDCLRETLAWVDQNLPKLRSVSWDYEHRS